MKQSYLKSRESLKPLGKELSTKKVMDYEQYGQKLSTYEKNKKNSDVTHLFDWSKPSEVISLNQQKPIGLQQSAIIQNNSLDTEQLLKSEGDKQKRHSQHSQDLDDSIQISPQSPKQPIQTYVQKVYKDFGHQYKNMSAGQVETQLKQMRQKLYDMNVKLNTMLDRYELMKKKQNRDVQINNPYQFLQKQIETNERILFCQKQQLKNMQSKDKQLQKKDFLVELNELVIEIHKEIHDMNKEKHSRWVDVEKIDKILKELEGIQGTEDQYRRVKELKIKIVYYFKKLKEQKLAEEDLDIEIENLSFKDQEITYKLQEMTQVAVQKCLEVSSNRKYLEIKKRFDELTILSDMHAKKKQSTIKCHQINEEKLERQIIALKKEMQKVEMNTQQLEYKSITIDEQTTNYMARHNVLTRELKSISYRFDQSLIHPEKNKFKPDFKRVISRLQDAKINKTIDLSNQDSSKKRFSMNDKNITYEQPSQNAEQSQINSNKMKPMLRYWKGKNDNQRYMDSPNQKYKTLETSNIFKPPLMIKSKK